MNTAAVVKKMRAWQTQNQIIVLVTGVFDILHIEHIRFLKKAKASGDKLVAGIETDQRVTNLKGHHRPIHPEAARVEQLNALKAVDAAFILPQQFDSQAHWESLLQTLKPNIYAVSSHTSWLENKQAIAQKYGIDFKIVHQHNPDFSTTKLAKLLSKEL